MNPVLPDQIWQLSAFFKAKKPIRPIIKVIVSSNTEIDEVASPQFAKILRNARTPYIVGHWDATQKRLVTCKCSLLDTV